MVRNKKFIASHKIKEKLKFTALTLRGLISKTVDFAMGMPGSINYFRRLFKKDKRNSNGHNLVFKKTVDEDFLAKRFFYWQRFPKNISR